MQYQSNLQQRNNYSYPTVALAGSLDKLQILKFNSTTEMDTYIHMLLHSTDINLKVIGYLSVIFWGFYSGQDGVIRKERALGKIDVAINGRDRTVSGKEQRITGLREMGIQYVADRIDLAIKHINENNYAQALTELNNLPQLQMAFSSKICAFLAPEKCGVIDSVISEKHPQFGFSTDAQGTVKNTVKNRDLYKKYCEYLQNIASEINNLPQDFRWQDNDETRHHWRALDVERSMYS